MSRIENQDRTCLVQILLSHTFLPWSFCTEKHKITLLAFCSQKQTECESHFKWFCTSLVKSLTLTLISPSSVVSSSPRGFYLRRVLSRHSSHWNIHKRDESRQTLAVLSPKPRNGCSHFKRPSILLAQDCPVWEWPGKTSERSSPRGRGKDSLSEWVRAGPCCFPHRTGKLLLPQISIVRFFGLLFSWRCSAIF